MAGTSSAPSRKPTSASATSPPLCPPDSVVSSTAALGRPSAIRRALPADAWVGYLFVLPLVVLVLLLIAYPLGSAVYLSLTEKYVGYPPRFVGLKNYVELTGDPVFRK